MPRDGAAHHGLVVQVLAAEHGLDLLALAEHALAPDEGRSVGLQELDFLHAPDHEREGFLAREVSEQDLRHGPRAHRHALALFIPINQSINQIEGGTNE